MKKRITKKEKIEALVKQFQSEFKVSDLAGHLVELTPVAVTKSQIYAQAIASRAASAQRKKRG